MALGKDIKAELMEISPELARFDAINPYRVPVGYFDTLAELILLRIKGEETTSPGEELELIAPFLSGLNKKMPYTVPQGYFENLSPKLSGTSGENREGRVVSLSSTRRLFRMAAAAVTVGVIAVTAWLFMKQPAQIQDQYAVNPDSAIQKDIRQKVNEISETEIADFIEGGSTILNYENSSSIHEIGEEDVKLMLADISDQELEKYLEQDNSLKEKFN